MVGPSNSAAYAEIRPIPGKNWPIYEKKKPHNNNKKSETYKQKQTFMRTEKTTIYAT